MLRVKKKAGRVALVPTGKKLVGVFIASLCQRRRDPLPMKGPAALPGDGQAREGSHVLRGGADREGGDPKPTAGEVAPLSRINVLQMAKRRDAKGCEHGTEVGGLNSGYHLLHYMDKEIRTALLDDPRQERHGPKMAGVVPQQAYAATRVSNPRGLRAGAARAQEQQGAARDRIQEGVYQKRRFHERVALEKKGPNVISQELMARAAARPPRGGPGPLSTFDKVVVKFHKSGSDKVSTRDAKLVQRRIDTEAASREAGEEVHESEGALRVGRRGRGGRQRDGERRSSYVGPPHGPTCKGSSGSGRVDDDHRSDGNPLEDRAVDCLGRYGQKSRRRVQPHVRGA